MELAEIIARLDMDIISTTRTRNDEYANERYLNAKLMNRRLDDMRAKRIELADLLVATGGDAGQIAYYRTELDSSYTR